MVFDHLRQLWLPIQNVQIRFEVIPEPNARSAVPGVSPGRGLLIPHGY